MNYREILIEEKVDEYVGMHKHFYRSLSSMIFDISFIQACGNLQNLDIMSDWITIKFLHRDVFENLITKVYRCFFDKSGADAINLFRFKNKVLSDYIKVEYKEKLISMIDAITKADELYQHKLKLLEKNIVGLRDPYIAHSLLDKQVDVVEVDLDDISYVVEKGCELFQVLSFEISDFYSFLEGDGYDFSEEFTYTKNSAELFVKYSMLSSKLIKKIECQYTELCTTDEVERLDSLIKSINDNKNKK